ncbi:MAG TPA: TonB-dependent receptor [Kofleriaceae bacterium]|nr:TonB-dependent receptor [Kofleriaceae bacterium]
MTHSTTAVAAVTGMALALGFASPAIAQPSPDDAPAAEAAPAPDPAPAAEPAPAPAPAAPPAPSDAELVAASQADAEIIEISDTAPAESASSVHISEDDLKYRSRTQVSDILRQVPGLMVSQHAGGGKSDQYFIRGFDADHGTDLAIFADGVPVNLPSHGHGQGYSDTHFLIPETITSVDVHKGPYAARFGDFYTAGAMELTTIDKVDGPTLWVAGGAPLAGPKALSQFNERIVGMASPELRTGDKALIAAQLSDTDGPFDNAQHFKQGNALVKWQGAVGPGDLKLETNWYAASWNASGQVPQSAVDDHIIDRFGSLDPSEGGDTSRTSLQIGYRVRDDHGGLWRAALYGVEYRLRLFSDFTLFARDPVHGDEIEQDDARFVWGLDTAYERHFDLAGMDTYLTAGFQARNDNTENALWHAQKRVRLASCFDDGANPCNDTEDRIRDVAGYAEATIHILPHVHLLPGLRFEQLSWDVDDLNPATRTDPARTTGGSAARTMVLPKLSLEAEATPKLDLFVNVGSGLHSNDARSAVATHGDGALARALGAEAGFRTTILPHARLSADFWYLHLDSELVWNGDDGTTEAAGPTRRYGVDLEAAYDPVPWLRFDANVAIAHSQFVHNAGNSNGLALAPKIIGQGGVTVLHGPGFVSLRGRGIGDRPGSDDDPKLVAEGYFILDLVAGYKIGKLDLSLTLNNLLDSQWREAQFADSSRVTPNGKIVEQMHFTPGIPLSATIAAAYQL